MSAPSGLLKFEFCCLNFEATNEPTSSPKGDPFMNRSELQQQLAAIEQDAEVIKQQLNKSFPTLQDANPGDKLEDGTVVIAKYNGAVLIAAPIETEVQCEWTPEFQPVFDNLKEHGFNSSDWFIPSEKQLKLAYKNAKQQFSSANYWSSTEETSTFACLVAFLNGRPFVGGMEGMCSVRAFRLVEL
jgi:hypothetical protein